MRSIKDFKRQIEFFVEREHVSFGALMNPRFTASLLFRQKYFHFFLTGVTGVAIALLITWFLTEFVFGRADYFLAYIVGTGFGLVYNFTLHTVMTFRTRERHVKRFMIFVTYSVLMAAFQAYLVSIITPIVGIKYYLLVIAGIIFVFSTVSFVVFKFSLFNE